MFNKAVIFCVSFVLLIVAGLFSLDRSVEAQTAGAPVTGYAWSANYGWIHFNPTHGGVIIDVDGDFSGYAWANPQDNTATPVSNNIGWINFGNTGCPSSVSPTHPTEATCKPHVDFISGKVTGFAKVISTGEYISLSGTNHVSPTANGTGGLTYDPATKSFSGYAWGAETDSSNQVYGAGWINFDGLVCEDCGTVVYQCSDDVNNNDGDNLIDDQDPGCYSDNDIDNGTYDPTDNSEYNYLAECSDGNDNDNDDKIDAADPGCHIDNDLSKAYLPNDESEENGSECSDREDNDNDGHVDFPYDPGCDSLNDDDEDNPSGNRECNDTIDNSDPEDTLADFGSDVGCDSRADNDETDTNQCTDGVDNNVNGVIDDSSECLAQCNDGRDNDYDGKIDYEGLDLNNDGTVDITADPGCSSLTDDTESDVEEGLAPKVDLRVRKIVYDSVSGNQIETNFVNSNNLEINVGETVELQWRVTGNAVHCYATGRPTTSTWLGYKSGTIGTEMVEPDVTTWFDISCVNGFTPVGDENKDSIRVIVKGANED